MMRRTKKLAQELLKQQMATSQGGFSPQYNILPFKTKININGRERWVPLKPPKYVDPKNMPNEPTHPFVEIYSNETAIWLQKFAESIMYSDIDTRYPLTNPKLDLSNPEISGYRIYLKGVGCTHIQISRIPGRNSVFQLDYYELATKHYSKVSTTYSSKRFKVAKKWSSKRNPIIPKLLLVAVVAISKIGYDDVRLVYASSDLELMDEKMSKKDSDLEYATRVACFFRFIQIYLRNYDFKTSNVSRLKITPLTFFGKQIEFKKRSS